MSGGGWEKSIYHKKYPWQLGQHSSVWISSCCFCMFLMLSLEVSKHKEDKLSVPASVTEWVNDLVPDIFSPVYLSVNWKKVFLRCQKLGHCPCLSVSFSSVEFIILPGPVVSVGYPMPCYTNVCISLLLSAWGDCRLFFWDWGCCCCGYQTECCRSEGLRREALTPLFLHLPTWLHLLFKIWVVFCFPATSDEASGERTRGGRSYHSNTGRKGTFLFLFFPPCCTLQFQRTTDSAKYGFVLDYSYFIRVALLLKLDR